ncbi:MAG: cytochrome c [Bacillota bacterium]|nr:cytochrome c [Bacillota bacterium]
MKVKKWLVLLLLLALVLVLAAGCGNGDTQPPDQNEPGEEPNNEPLTAEALIEARCSSCHIVDRVYSRDRDKDSWPEIVTRMVSKSPGLLSDEEYEIVVNYLQENYSK